MNYRIIFKISVFIVCALIFLCSGAAGAENPVYEAAREAAREDLYKSAGAIMLVWAGIAFYLFRIDRKVAILEKEINEK